MFSSVFYTMIGYNNSKINPPNMCWFDSLMHFLQFQEDKVVLGQYTFVLYR